MMKLVKLALVVGALAAVWAFVPVGDRTLSERWRAAGSAERFAERSWAELREAFRDEPTAPAKTKPPGATPRPQSQARAKPGRDARPAEGHTDADRRALDQILAERLKN
jgi:hypothetical protein